MKKLSFLLFLSLSIPLRAELPVDEELTSHPDSPVYEVADPTSLPSTYVCGDGHEIPIQREWLTSHKPGDWEGVELEDRPFRVYQRNPRHVYTEEREGRTPIYYFKDVRWILEAGVKGEKRFCRRVYFTTVRVDLEKVESAYFMMKPFKPKWFAGHSAVYLKMAPGGMTSLDGEESDGLVFSYEAHMKVNQGYSPLKGQFGAYDAINIVGNWKDFLFRSLVLDHPLTLKKWTLQLQGQELRNLAIAIGRTVKDYDPDAKYNTFFQSCIHAAVDVVNQAVNERRRVAFNWGIIPNPAVMVPSLVHRALLRKRLIDGNMTEITTVEEGLTGIVSDTPPPHLMDPALMD